MAIIEERNSDLFADGSIIKVSNGLYEAIHQTLKKSFGAKLRKITKQLLISIRDEFFANRELIVVSQKIVRLRMTIADIKGSEVDVILGLPLYSKNGEKGDFIRKIAERIGIPEGIYDIENGWIRLSLLLKGDDSPVQIFPPEKVKRFGSAQKFFITKKEAQEAFSRIFP